MKWRTMTLVLMPLTVYGMDQDTSSEPASSLVITTTFKSEALKRILYESKAVYRRTRNGAFNLDSATIKHDNHNSAYVTDTYNASIAHVLMNIVKREDTSLISKQSDIPRHVISSLLKKIDPRDTRYKVFVTLLNPNKNDRNITLRFCAHKKFQGSKSMLCAPKTITIPLTTSDDAPHIFEIQGETSSAGFTGDPALYTLIIKAAFTRN